MAEEGGSITFYVIGVISAESPFDSLLEVIQRKAGSITSFDIDLGGLDRIDSQGVREWLLFVAQIPESVSIQLHRITESFLQNANYLLSLLGSAQRRLKPVSFFAPYRCPRCKGEVQFLLRPDEIIEDASGALRAPARECPSCSGPLEFDWLEQEYFLFLSHDRRLAGKK